VFVPHKEKKRSEKRKKRGEKEKERFFAAAEKKNEKNSNLQRTALRSSFLFHITHLSLTYSSTFCLNAGYIYISRVHIK
tara:strand:- start:227 stop:463 length:237 start_codon:yes stop_codon:yes gene_type:complete